MFDINSLPVSGGVVASGLVWAGVSAFVLGPLVGDRTAHLKLNWPETCERSIRASAQTDGPAATVQVPSLCGLFFGIYGDDGARYCAMHGHHIDGPANRLLGGIQAQRDEVHRRRMEFAVSRADSRCSCALTTATEKRRLQLALHAGTARLVPLKNWRSELVTALNSTECAGGA